MKTILTTVIALLTLSLTAQDLKLAVGKTSVDGDAIMDFGPDLRGMVLGPIQNAATAPAVGGTIAFDGNTGSFRFYNGTSWSTAVPGGQTGTNPNAVGTDTYKQIIGAETSAATGVVIFGEDSGETQALVLPKFANGHLRFNNPVPGLIYYDTVDKTVKVYNGNAWTSF